jgi:ribosomal protein L40E
MANTAPPEKKQKTDEKAMQGPALRNPAREKYIAFDFQGQLVNVPREFLEGDTPALNYLANIASEKWSTQKTAIGISVDEQAQYVNAIVQSVKNGFLTVDPTVSMRGVFAVANRWAMQDLVEVITAEHPELKQCVDFEPGKVQAVRTDWLNVCTCTRCGAGFVQTENGSEACLGRHEFETQGGVGNEVVICRHCGAARGRQDAAVPCRQGWHVAG